MFPTAPGNYSFNAALADEGGTYRLMADIAAVIEPGDVITLSADPGAGPTPFHRAVRRPRGRKDDICSSSHPFLCRRREYRGAEPDIYPHADLCAAAFQARSRRSLPVVRPGRTCRDRPRGCGRRHIAGD